MKIIITTKLKIKQGILKYIVTTTLSESKWLVNEDQLNNNVWLIVKWNLYADFNFYKSKTFTVQ